MQDFWDAKARENAEFFVDDTLDYNSPDLDRFWSGGEVVVDRLLAETGARAIAPGDVVLEIGCGVGRLTRVLAARGREVLALDVSEEMLRRARDANPALANVRWLHGDGTTLAGVADASVDAIVSFVVFQHIPDPEITLGYVREMGRVLRPGGFAAFQVSNDPSIHRPRLSLRHRAAALVGRAPSGQDHVAWLGSAVALDDLRAAAADGGLEVGEIAHPGSQFCLVRLERPAHATSAP